MKGWIKLHRKILLDKIFTNEKGLRVWLWCLLRASHTKKSIYIGRQKVNLKQGQFVYGRISASESLNMPESTIRNWINILKEDSYLDIKPTNKYSVISILNWRKYQHKDSKVENKWKTNEKQKDTNKKDKKDNNVKNIYTSLNDLKEKDLQEIANKYKVSIGFVNLQFEKLKNYCSSKGKKYKNYKSALCNFVLGDIQKNIERKSMYDKKSAIDARSIIQSQKS